MINRGDLVQFLRVYSFQPATAFWRAVEVPVLRQFLPTQGICLDLGCGDGKLTAIAFGDLLAPGLTLVGVDVDADETHQAARRSLYTRIHTCPAAQIPEPALSFDCILSNSVLEHIPEIEPTLASVANLLKPGGHFLFTVPTAGFHQALAGPLNPRITRETYLLEMDRRLAHFRYWGADEWCEHLAAHGLEVVRMVEYFDPAEVRRWENISRLTAGILYALGRRQHAPIQVQKKLGLRQAQNALTLPAWFAAGLAALLSAGMRPASGPQAGLLIVARRQA